jgi:hypothetical protein
VARIQGRTSTMAYGKGKKNGKGGKKVANEVLGKYCGG